VEVAAIIDPYKAVYQSRRRPGTRRLLPNLDRPAGSGLIFARRDARNSRFSRSLTSERYDAPVDAKEALPVSPITRAFLGRHGPWLSGSKAITPRAPDRGTPMRAVVMHAAGDVRVEERGDPRVVEPADAIIRLGATFAKSMSSRTRSGRGFPDLLRPFNRDANTYGIRAVESCRARQYKCFAAPSSFSHRIPARKARSRLIVPWSLSR
jgi:hypothetical protein